MTTHRYELLVDTVDLSIDIPDGHETLLSLEQAAWLPELGGHFTAAMLRTRVNAGEIAAERHGRQIYVTRKDIEDWRRACRVRACPPDSGSAPPAPTKPGGSGQPSGSSGTPGNSIARDAALKTMLARLGHSKTT